MKTRSLAILTALIIMITATPTYAQIGSVVSTSVVPATGITGQILDENGLPVPNATIIVSRVDMDYGTGYYFVNSATAKKFGPCTSSAKNCVDTNGRYLVTDVPEAIEGFGAGRELDIRAEAKGLAHFITMPTRVWLGGRYVVTASPTLMYRLGFESSDAYMWWYNDKIVAIAVAARQDWSEDIVVDFEFKGSSWTKAEVGYGTTTVIDNVDTDWRWIVRLFWAPSEDGMATFGGNFCGTVTMRSLYDEKFVKERLPQVCVGLQPEVLAMGKKRK